MSVYSHNALLMKVRLHTPILDAIDPQLKVQIRTLNLHVQLKVQILKLDALGRRQAREQVLRNGAEVSGQGADGDEAVDKGTRRVVVVASDQLVFHNERLSGAEVASVVKGNGRVGRYRGALTFT